MFASEMAYEIFNLHDFFGYLLSMMKNPSSRFLDKLIYLGLVEKAKRPSGIQDLDPVFPKLEKFVRPNKKELSNKKFIYNYPERKNFIKWLKEK